eukprot:15440596-Alexandrium_andersonii.AAC.1
MALSHCRLPKSAIRNPPKARQCCNLPQSAIRHAQMRKQQHRFWRSELELRGPENGLKIGPRGS